MTSEEYGQILDDFELDKKLGLISEDFDLTKYIEQRRREFESKADGGSIGIEVLFTDKKPRKNFFMGGPALTGTALDIYNSMKAYGFPDEEIANALRARGLYDTTPTPTAPAQPLQPNITRPNGGGKDENDGPGVKDPYAGLGYSSANFGLGQGINKDAVMDYEADAYSIGRTPLGQLSRFGVGMVQALKNVPTPVNLIRKGIEFTKQRAAEKKAQEEAIARDAFREAMRKGPSFYDSLRGGKGASVSRASREQAGPGFGDVSESASFAKGGLATMFTRRR